MKGLGIIFIIIAIGCAAIALIPSPAGDSAQASRNSDFSPLRESSEKIIKEESDRDLPFWIVSGVLAVIGLILVNVPSQPSK